MIYLDNSATTYPKPLSVRRKMAQALEQFGANPGRGGFKMSLQTAQAVYDVRQKAASFFGAAGPECISFQPSCTQSLNIVIHSLKRGDHVLVPQPLCHFIFKRDDLRLEAVHARRAVAEQIPSIQHIQYFLALFRAQYIRSRSACHFVFPPVFSS